MRVSGTDMWRYGYGTKVGVSLCYAEKFRRKLSMVVSLSTYVTRTPSVTESMRSVVSRSLTYCFKKVTARCPDDKDDLETSPWHHKHLRDEGSESRETEDVK